jgi:glycosyltransferase involved in cell wall biosynthesis
MSDTGARPLRIAHVDAERGFSGGEVQVFLLIDGLAARGHDNRLLCPPASAAEAEAKRRAIAVCGVPMRGALDLVAIWRLARTIKAADADLVHLHTGRAAWLGGAAARLAGVAAVVTRRMDRPVRPGWRTRLVYEHYARRTVAISPAVVDCLLAGGVPATRIVCIPSAVDPARIQPTRDRATVRAAEGAASEAVVLLAVAALVHRKGIDILLGSLATLAERGLRPVLWIAGDGLERGALAAQAEGLGVARHVRFLGQRADIGNLLAAGDVVVLPSRREGLGVAALEAMAAGRPVVASAVGGLGDAVVDERTGLLVPPENAPALATALERLLRDPELRARLGAAGPQRVAEGFLPEQMVAAYERVYREILTRGTR